MAEAISSAKLRHSTKGYSSSKRKKENQDKISSLPDALLCHILSFLPTKYAVGTSVLSTRWRYLWTSVPVLHFDEYLVTVDHGCDRLFMNSVERVLFFNSVQSIEKFYLRCSGKCDFSRVNAWICVAIMRNVVELDLDFNMSVGDELRLPQNLFSCEKLKVLKICDHWHTGNIIVPNVPNSLSLPSLKVLHLRYLQRLNDASLRKLLSGAPALEQLEIARYELDDMWTLHVKSCSLKSLSIQNLGDYVEIDGNHCYKVVVDAPNLEFLEVMDYMSEKLKIKQLSSIVEARIEVSLEGICGKDLFDYANVVVQLLRQISNVKFLRLSGYTLRTLDEGMEEGMDDLHDLVTFHNLTHLEVAGDLISFDILECMPSLEVLVLEVEDDDQWDPSETAPECLLSCPAMVQFKSFSASEVEMEIVEYLLKNAMVLEKMTISCNDCHTSTDPDVLKKLLTFPRASSSCQILFT